MAAPTLFADKESNSVKQGQITLRERQGEQQCATRITIDFSSTVSPLRVASILMPIDRSNFQLQKKLISRINFQTFITVSSKLDH